MIAHDVPEVLEKEIDAGPDPWPPPHALPPAESLATERDDRRRAEGPALAHYHRAVTDPAIGDWVSVSDRPAAREVGQERRCICVRLSLAHPFMDRFGGTDAASIEPLLRLAAAIGLAETAARDAGVPMAGTFRRNINELFRDA